MRPEILKTEIDVQGWSRALFGSPSRLAWALVGLGIALRVAEYAGNRYLWEDEHYVVDCVAGWPIFGMGKLPHGQLAPPGFLIVERVAARVLGTSRYALRLFPLVCGIAALVLLRDVALRYLDPWAAPAAVVLFSLSDDILYYSCEIKQYAGDMAVTLACLALGHRLRERELTPRRVAGAAALGAAATWMSHPAIFTLAGVGIVLWTDAVLARRWRQALGVVVIGAAWLAGFASCLTVSNRILREDTILWPWWAFSFLPLPPRSMIDFVRLYRHVLNLFDSPLGMITPLGPMASALVGLALFLLGGIVLGRRRPGNLFLLLSPMLFAMAASGLGRYPFHGRVVLFLAPTLVLLIAQGLATIGRRAGKATMIALVVFLALEPTAECLNHLEHVRQRVFDPHADLRRDLFTTAEFLGLPPDRAPVEPMNMPRAGGLLLKTPGSPPAGRP